MSLVHEGSHGRRPGRVDGVRQTVPRGPLQQDREPQRRHTSYRAAMDWCEECGFEYDLSEARQAGQSIVEGVAEFATILRICDVDLAARPQPSIWSPLEYGCHLRDVLLVQRKRVLLARRVDRPLLHPMGRDERVEHDGYGEQDPDDVARHLTDAAQMSTNVLNRKTRPPTLDPGSNLLRRQLTYPERPRTGGVMPRSTFLRCSSDCTCGARHAGFSCLAWSGCSVLWSCRSSTDRLRRPVRNWSALRGLCRL